MLKILLMFFRAIHNGKFAKNCFKKSNFKIAPAPDVNQPPPPPSPTPKWRWIFRKITETKAKVFLYRPEVMNEGIFSLLHGLYQLNIRNGLHTKIKRWSPQSGWIPWMSALVMCRILFRLDFLMAGLPVGELTAGCRDAGRISWLASCLLCPALFSVVLWSIFSGFPESFLTSRKEQEAFFSEPFIGV